MDVREKLVELLKEISYDQELGWYDLWDMREGAEDIADLLIANGVTVQERGHWVSYESDEPYGCADDKEWHRCSKCGKDAYGRCHEDEWYSAPILSAYCPHCGAKMMPQPPKGE
jgi:hypothetical protein